MVLSSFFQDLTEYNTAQNRRLGIGAEESSPAVVKKRRRSSVGKVVFKEGEEIINPGEISFENNQHVDGSKTLKMK